jgi:molecular chaperone DnaK
VPQIEVTFDIDANGILNVSAKDKDTGKEQSIIIKANSGLSDEEIQRMVQDAEAHAEEDRKFQELVEARNQAESMINAIEKAITELGEEVSEDEKTKANEAIEKLKTASAGDDLEAIKTANEELMTAAAPIMQKSYAKMQQGAGAGASAEPNADNSADNKNDDVIDAEFEEVKK